LLLALFYFSKSERRNSSKLFSLPTLSRHYYTARPIRPRYGTGCPSVCVSVCLSIPCGPVSPERKLIETSDLEEIFLPRARNYYPHFRAERPKVKVTGTRRNFESTSILRRIVAIDKSEVGNTPWRADDYHFTYMLLLSVN